MSFLFETDPKETAAADLIAEVGRKLQQVSVSQGITQSEIADKLAINRSQVNRSLSGFNNMTLRTLAELALALNGRVKIDISINADHVDQIGTIEGNNVVLLEKYRNGNMVEIEDNSAVFDEDLLSQAVAQHAG